MNKRQVVLSVNGRDHEVWIAPSDTLLDVLHDELGLADVRYGCGEGVCGTCTVLLDGEPVNSCLVFAVQADGCEITTVRGLAADGELHDLQKTFIEHAGSQCGFCTPGMLLVTKWYLDRHPAADREELRHAIAGNLCRCTGYTKILDAVEAYRDLRPKDSDGD
jgi:carbon-monoxide dehydrogenase small subunit